MLQGRRALVIGVANARSIAWGIADRWRQEGAEVFVTYQSERFRKPVEKLVADNWGPFDTAGNAIPTAACDVTSEEDMAALWRTLHERGFCCSSPSSPLEEGGGRSKAAGEGTERAPRAAPEARRRGGGGVGASQASAAKTGAAEQAPGGSATSSCSSGRAEGEGQGGGLRLQRQGLPVGGGVAAPTKTVDIVLHSVAHAPTDAMRQGFLMGTTREAFVSAHVVSAYSLVSSVRHALPFLSPGASVVALTYIGSQRAAANYNVMGPAKASLESCARALAAELGGDSNSQGPGGVRVNCLSPGPVRTMAARGIVGFDEMRREAAGRAPLGRAADLDEIAAAATFLASPLSSAVTGQTLYADCGFSAIV
ncbi:unnamed protein product [Ectocarpus sp. CCAP 1310/34]|nr:unnamed protein product [Ectocarpus sp. CCAP 1310/34]